MVYGCLRIFKSKEQSDIQTAVVSVVVDEAFPNEGIDPELRSRSGAHPLEPDKNDWVVRRPRSGMNDNTDVMHFLQHVEAIRVLWQVRFQKLGLNTALSSNLCNLSI